MDRSNKIAFNKQNMSPKINKSNKCSTYNKHNINFGPNNLKLEKDILLHDSNINTTINDILKKFTNQK